MRKYHSVSIYRSDSLKAVHWCWTHWAVWYCCTQAVCLESDAILSIYICHWCVVVGQNHGLHESWVVWMVAHSQFTAQFMLYLYSQRLVFSHTESGGNRRSRSHLRTLNRTNSSIETLNNISMYMQALFFWYCRWSHMNTINTSYKQFKPSITLASVDNLTWILWTWN